MEHTYIVRDRMTEAASLLSLVKCANKSHNCFPFTAAASSSSSFSFSPSFRMKLKVICGQSQNKETFISNFLDVFNYLRPLEHRISCVHTHTHTHTRVYPIWYMALYIGVGAYKPQGLSIYPLYLSHRLMKKIPEYRLGYG